MAQNGYEGKIPQQPSVVVKGPYANNRTNGSTVVHSGNDLRSGKNK